MDRSLVYRSCISPTARERVTAWGAAGCRVRAEYYSGNDLIGIRHWLPNGVPQSEYAYQKGNRHGWQYFWNEEGNLISAQPYDQGVQHGIAYQWANSGRLLGTYTMDHGSGFDLWWCEHEEGNATLAEVYTFVEGHLHGFEWQFTRDELREEKHWHQGKLHGIERKWNSKRNLSRGFPRHWIHGELVTKHEYLKTLSVDCTLIPVSSKDNNPYRIFPPLIKDELKKIINFQ
jgi:hypothetical protein